MSKHKRLEPIPPGEILAEEFMKPNRISQNRLSRDIDVNPARINDIVHGRSAITAPIALRLGKIFRHHARALDEFAKLLRITPRARRGLAKD
jgi:antitoxin HigA-1